MENKKFEITFEDKEQLMNYNKIDLCNQLSGVLGDINDKYIIRTNGMSEELYSLLGFNNNDEVKEQFNDKSILELKPYIKIIVDNIYKSLENKDSFISRCLTDYGYHYKYRDLNIEFKLETYSCYGRDEQRSLLEFKIMSYQKGAGSCGTGRSFNFDLVDSEKLNKVKNEVSKMNLPESVKNKYFEYFDSETEDNLSIDLAKKDTIEGIINLTNEFIYDNEEKWKQYYGLLKQGVKEELTKFININNWMGDISDAITVDYGLKKATSYDVLVNHVDCKEGEYYTNDNKIEIKFLDEVVKTISKTSYTVYEIN